MQIQYQGHVTSLQALSQDRLRVLVQLEAAAGCGSEPLVFNIPKKMAERMLPGDAIYVKLGVLDTPN